MYEQQPGFDPNYSSTDPGKARRVYNAIADQRPEWPDARTQDGRPLADTRTASELGGGPGTPGAWLASLTSEQRKEVAVARGLFAYFPDALALIARHSVRSNEKHNPGQPVHWAREKSDDHEDCIARHGMAVAVNENAKDGTEYEIIARAWRALAALQLWAERRHARREKI